MNCVNRASRLTEKGLESASFVRSLNCLFTCLALGWNSIRSSVIQYMTPIRDKFVIEHSETTYKIRLGCLRGLLDAYQSTNTPRNPASDCEPGFFELATLPVIRTLLEDMSNDVPQESLTLLVDIPGSILSWVGNYKSVYTELALKGLGESSANLELTTLLDLAMVSFVCRRCYRRQIRWPHVLSHRCFRDRSRVERGSNYDVIAWQQTHSDHDASYRGEDFAAFDDHVEVTRDIIFVCGLVPDTATYQDMEEAGSRIACSLCAADSFGRRQLFDWQAAVSRSSHFITPYVLDRTRI